MRSIVVALAFFVPSLFAPPGHAHVRPVAPPLVATPPGEPGVRLEAASMQVELAGGTARTTLDLRLRNDGTRRLEGTLRFPLQPGQQVVAFALDVDGHLRAAVPVEKERGRQVLEAIERRGADPGLLEQAQGDYFRLRIYPFAPGGTREVRITLGEALPARATTLRLPVAFAAGLPALPVLVRGAGAPTVEGALQPLRFARTGHDAYALTLQRGDLAAGRPLRIAFAPRSTPAVQVQAWGDARYFAADVPVALPPRPRALPARMTLLWDASASGATRAHDLEFALLDAYFGAARSMDVDLVRFRDAPEPAQRFTVRGGDWSALRRALEETVYDGATSLRGWRPAGAGDVLLFGDGLFNYADAPLPAFGEGQRLYTVRAGDAGDAARLQALAWARHGDAIALDDRDGLAAARARLLDEAPRLAAVEALGATDVLAGSPVVHDGVLRVAGRLTDAAPRVVLVLDQAGTRTRIAVPIADATESQAAAPLWAQYRLARLMEAPAAHRAAIARLGGDFGIVTPGSSLIVLEAPADYVRYHIAPPEELRAEVGRLAQEAAARDAAARSKQLDGVRAAWQERIAWWSRPFPKGEPPRPEAPRPQRTDAAGQGDGALAAADAAAAAAGTPTPAPAPAPVGMPPPAPPREPDARTLDRVEVTGSRISEEDVAAAAAGGAPAIRLQPWTPDSPLARALRGADADTAYRRYLDARDAAGAPSGAAFYLDVAGVLFDKRRPELALRVLSNLAELDLDNRHVLRVLAYRLMEAGRADLAVPVLEQVLAMGDDEPQSYRDLALAHAALGERQQALDLLYEVVTGTWDGRFPGIEVTALAELNALVATAPAPLDTHRVAPDLLRNLPLDLRAVLSWDADDSDMDLWVTDPNGERCYYRHPLTWQGGHLSADFTGGYGPEEFALRTAKPGHYKVEANYFGDRQQVITGPTTVQLWLSTGFGTARQQDRRITLRLKDARDTVLVGEFEVK